MRILKIRFKNLNSLAGEWELDLTAPEYACDGIFAIIGRTGAGKSTILDAICLALYGHTPRLGKVTQSSNEIMSRRTGDCFAELEFESNSGRYRCNWSQRRAYGKADGELQAPKHTLSDYKTGKILESRLSKVASRVEAVTGMDFNRFTRSMLLAQGAFAVFLQASGSDRAPILEQITGTEIYSTISSAVYDRQQQEDMKLRQLDSELAMVNLFSDEQRSEIQKKISDTRQNILSLKENIQSISQLKLWLEKIRDLDSELEKIAIAEKELQRETEVFSPEMTRLKLAERAAEVEAAYVSIQSIRRQCSQENEQINVLRPQLDKAKAEAQKATEKLIEMDEKQASAREAIKIAAPILRQTRELDLLLNEKEKNIAERRNDIQKDELKYTKIDRQLQRTKKQQIGIQEKLRDIRRFLDEQKTDESLISNFSVISEQCTMLQKRTLQQRELEEKITAEEDILKKLDDALKKQEKQERACRETHNETQKRLQKTRETLLEKLAGKSLRDYESELRHLEKERSRQELIASFDMHRENLEPGQPCPLCGSEIHPWAQETKPQSTAIQQEIEILENFIKESQTLQQQIEKLDQKERQALEKYLAAEREHQKAENQFIQQKAILENEKKARNEILAQIVELKNALLSRLQPYQIQEIQAERAELLIQKLEQRLQQYQSRQQELSILETQLKELNLENESLQRSFNELNSVIGEKDALIQRASEVYEEIKAKREALFGKKNPDTIETQLQQNLKSAEDKLQTARQQADDAGKKAEALLTRLADTEERLALYQEKEALEKIAFEKILDEYQFADKDEFLKARLPVDMRKTIREQAKKLEQRKNNLKEQQTDRQKRLEEEKSRELTQSSLIEILAEERALNEEMSQENQNLGAALEALEKNEEKKAIFQEKSKQREKQAQNLQRWAQLNQLIGSKSGNKFRNFAQNLTFDLMIDLANAQLQKMNDRYLLVRNQNEILELNVLDKYQGGEVRSAKNLSGGESFIVSLALALGLSGIASRKVRVDSLFLDEGFGTLDDEALHTALETLAELRQEGKLIGIISHVAALKERIPTQVQVIKRSGGTSILKGPGVRKI